MRKGTFKRIASLSICAVMALGMLVGIPAVNVEAGSDYTSIIISEPGESGSGQEQPQFTSYLIYSDDEGSSEKPNPPSGVTYDKASDTLTINNLSMEKGTLRVYGAAVDFKLNVKGSNSLNAIDIMFSEEWSGAKKEFTITGDGTLVLNKTKDAYYPICVREGGEQIIHVDKYVNLTIYKNSEEGFSAPLIENGFTSLTDGNKAIAIDGTISGKYEIKKADIVSAEPKEMTFGIASDTNEVAIPLYKRKNGNEYVAFKENGTDSDDDPTYTQYYVDFGANHTFLRYAYNDKAQNLGEYYEPCTSRPTDFANFVKTNVSDGMVEITGIVVDNVVCYPICTNGNHTYFYQEGSGTEYDREKNETRYYTTWKICDYPAESAAIIDSSWGRVYTSSPTLTPKEEFKKESVDGYENYYDTTMHDLTAHGYTPQYEHVYYTYELYADPLVVTAKAKPAAAINIASDSITKTVGDAAFSLGATTDAGASLTYTSDNTKVATVSAAGQVTVAGAGTAKITITASGENFQTATKVVTVTVNEAAPTTTEAPKTEQVATGTSTTDEKTGATYTVTESTDGKVEVEYTASATSKDKKVTIPSTVEVNGVTATVTAIADNAFSGNKTITTVTIPATVEDIGDNAFKNCTKLKTVTLPASVEEVGKNAFSGCSSLTTVTVKGSSLTKVDQGAFKNCKKLKTVTLPKSVTTIGKEAFSGDKKLKTITIKSTKIKSVGKNAFKGVPKSTTIKVPKKQKKAYTKLLKKAGFKGKIK